MMRHLLTLLTCASLALMLVVVLLPYPDPALAPADEGPGALPSDWFWQQRAYPHGAIDPEGYRLALEQAAAKREEATLRRLSGDKRALDGDRWSRGPPGFHRPDARARWPRLRRAAQSHHRAHHRRHRALRHRLRAGLDLRRTGERAGRPRRDSAAARIIGVLPAQPIASAWTATRCSKRRSPAAARWPGCARCCPATVSSRYHRRDRQAAPVERVHSGDVHIVVDLAATADSRHQKHLVWLKACLHKPAFEGIPDAIVATPRAPGGANVVRIVLHSRHLCVPPL